MSSNTYINPLCGYALSELVALPEVAKDVSDADKDYMIDLWENCIICNNKYKMQISYGLHINNKNRTKEEAIILNNSESICGYFFEELAIKKSNGSLSKSPLLMCKLCGHLGKTVRLSKHPKMIIKQEKDNQNNIIDIKNIKLSNEEIKIQTEENTNTQLSHSASNDDSKKNNKNHKDGDNIVLDLNQPHSKFDLEYNGDLLISTTFDKYAYIKSINGNFHTFLPFIPFESSDKKDFLYDMEYILGIDKSYNLKDIDYINNIENPYANYNIGLIYMFGSPSITINDKFEPIDVNVEIANMFFKKAYIHFEQLISEHQLAENQLLENNTLKNKISKYDEGAILCCLGFMTQNGLGVDININKTISFYNRSISFNYTLAKVYLALHYLSSYRLSLQNLSRCSLNIENNRIFVKNGIELLLDAANNDNNSYAQYRLGCMYYNGQYQFEKNITKAIDYFNSSANGNCSDACIFLATIYLSGRIPENYKLSIILPYIYKSALLYHPYGLFLLGFIYLNNNFKISYNCFLKSAILNCCDGQHFLSICYDNGYGTDINLKQSYDIINEAAGLYHRSSIRKLSTIKRINGDLIHKEIQKETNKFAKYVETKCINNYICVNIIPSKLICFICNSNIYPEYISECKFYCRYCFVSTHTYKTKHKHINNTYDTIIDYTSCNFIIKNGYIPYIMQLLQDYNTYYTKDIVDKEVVSKEDVSEKIINNTNKQNNVALIILLHLLDLNFFPTNSSISIYLNKILEKYCNNDIYQLSEYQILYILATIEFVRIIDNVELYYHIGKEIFFEKYEKINPNQTITDYHYYEKDIYNKDCKFSNECFNIACRYIHPPGHILYKPYIPVEDYTDILKLMKSWANKSSINPVIYNKCIYCIDEITNIITSFYNNTLNSPFDEFLFPNYFSFKIEIPDVFKNINFKTNLDELGSLCILIDDITLPKLHMKTTYSKLLDLENIKLYEAYSNKSKLFKTIVDFGNFLNPSFSVKTDYRFNINLFKLIHFLHKEESKKFYNNPENKILKEQKLKYIKTLLNNKESVDNIQNKYMLGFKKNLINENYHIYDNNEDLDYSLIDNWEPALNIINISCIYPYKLCNINSDLCRKYFNYTNIIKINNVEYDKNKENEDKEINANLIHILFFLGSFLNNNISVHIETIKKIKEFYESINNNGKISILEKIYITSYPIVCSIFNQSDDFSKITTIGEYVNILNKPKIELLKSSALPTIIPDYIKFQYNIWSHQTNINKSLTLFPINNYLKIISSINYMSIHSFENINKYTTLILHIPSLSLGECKISSENLKNIHDKDFNVNFKNNTKTINFNLFCDILVDYYKLELFGYRPRFIPIIDPFNTKGVALLMTMPFTKNYFNNIWSDSMHNYNRVHILNAWFICANSINNIISKEISFPNLNIDFNNVIIKSEILYFLRNIIAVPLYDVLNTHNMAIKLNAYKINANNCFTQIQNSINETSVPL